MSAEDPPQDSGRRRRRGAERGSAFETSGLAAQPAAPFPPLDLLSRDEIESIHRTALTVLKEIGIDFLHDGARAMLKEAGADVDPGSNRVRFDPALIEAQIGRAPREFTLHARNPARHLTIGGRHVAFGSVASAPNAFDRAGGGGPERSPTIGTFYVSGRASTRSTSGAAIRSNRSTCMPPFAISTRSAPC